MDIVCLSPRFLGYSTLLYSAAVSLPLLDTIDDGYALTSRVYIHGFHSSLSLTVILFFICLLQGLEGTEYGVLENRHQAGVHIPRSSLRTCPCMYCMIFIWDLVGGRRWGKDGETEMF